MLFRAPRMGAAELAVLEQVRSLRGLLRNAVSEPRRWRGKLRRQTFARAVRGSNTIEGYNVTLDDALAVIEGEEPLEAEVPTIQAVKGYRDALTYVLQLADDPHFTYSSAVFRALHFMMMQHDLDKSPGKYRAGPAFVYDEALREVVYEGPPWENVPELVDELVGQLNNGGDESSPLVRGAMAHLNLAMIHPFRDGNGRMARALQTLVLAREGILAPEFCSIEEYLGANTPEYYEVLAAVGQGSWHPENDARPWVRFILTAHLRQARTILYRIRLFERLWSEVEQVVAHRGLPERMVGTVFDAAQGFRIRNATHRAFAEVSPNVASRDLRVLIDAKLLRGHGQKRGKYYTATDEIRALAARARGEKPEMTDPFETQLALM